MMRAMGYWLLVAGLIQCTVGYGQRDSLAEKYARTIKASDIERHLMELASDAYEGRETGMAGQKKAANYISEYFQSLGVSPCIGDSYVQTYPLKSERITGSVMTVNDVEYGFLKDFMCFPGFEDGSFAVDEVLFVGYGIETTNYSDYAGVDATGKVVFVLEGEPVDKKGLYKVTGSIEPSEWSTDWREKRRVAEEKGAKALIVVKRNFRGYVGRVKYWLEKPGMRLDYPIQRGEEVLPTYFVSEALGNVLLKQGGGKEMKKLEKRLRRKAGQRVLSVPVRVNMIRERTDYTGENVLAFFEGSDAGLKEELVVITAHYDHIGIVDGEINNGADDDGSGTCTALEIAEALAEARKDGVVPKRSILVMTVSGEEKGLLGSEWYSEYPVFPLEATVCNLNIDMIGRVDEAHAENENYVYLIGSDKLSSELHEVSESCNDRYTNLGLDYTFNAPDDPNRFYYRSDHYNFAKHGIPVIFYFSGVHEDYHKPGDDPEKILYEKTAKIGRLVFHTAWEVANRQERLKVDVVNDFD